MKKLIRRLADKGFFLFFIAAFLLAIGVSQDITILRNIGLVILAAIGLYMLVRTVRGVWFPPRPAKAGPAPPGETTRPPAPRDPSVERASDI